MGQLKYDALEKKCEAEMLQAKAILEVYFTSSVGIGEHHQIIDEMNKQLLLYHDAKGKLESLQEIVRHPVEENSPSPQEEE
jgi:hypothetical protein